MTEGPSAAAHDDPAARPGVHLSHRQILFIFAGLMLGMFLAALDQTIVSAALPTIVGELGGLNQITWVVTSYLLTSTITILLWGKLSDIYGRKVMFQTSIGLFLAASALVGLSPNMLFLVAARGLQGIGAGGIMSLAFAIIGDILSPRERGKYMGLMGMVFVVSMIIGPFLGGMIVDHISWRWVFYINLPIGIPAIFITGLVLRLPFNRNKVAVDYTGFALQALGAGALVVALAWGGQAAPWSSAEHPPTYTLRWFPGVGTQVAPAGSLEGVAAFLADWLEIGLLVAALGLAAAFLWWESRTKEPLLPLRLFGNRNFNLASAGSFVVGAGMFGGFIFLPTYLQVATGVSATNSGFLLLPMMAGMFPFMTVSGIVISKTGRYKLWPVVGLPVATIGLLVLSTLTADTSWPVLITGMFLLGAGIGMTMQVMVVIVQNTLAMRDMGIGTASNTFIRQMGGVFGIGAFGAIFSARLRDTMADVARIAAEKGIDVRSLGGTLQASPSEIHKLDPAIRDPITAGVAHAITQVFLSAAPVMALGFILVLFIREVPLRNTRNLGAAALEGGEAMVPAADSPVSGAVAASRGLPANTLARIDPRPGQAIYEKARQESAGPPLGAPPRLPPVRSFSDRVPPRTAPLSAAQVAELHRKVDRLRDPRPRGPARR